MLPNDTIQNIFLLDLNSLILVKHVDIIKEDDKSCNRLRKVENHAEYPNVGVISVALAFIHHESPAGKNLVHSQLLVVS